MVGKHDLNKIAVR